MQVLFVCTANVCRSRMAEEVFRVLAWSVAGREGHAVRSAGTHPDPGGRPLGSADLEWADVVAVMEPAHEAYIRSRWPAYASKVRVLDIPDVYVPGDPLLKDLLVTHVLALLAESEPGRARSGCQA